MSNETPIERRDSPRNKNNVFMPVFFECQGNRVDAVLVDFSRSGAQFKAINAIKHIKMKVDDEIEYSISTSFGPTLCHAKTKWTLNNDGHHVWGVEFTRVATASDDPLRLMIESIPVLDSGSSDYAS
jgi:hypothetical protein